MKRHRFLPIALAVVVVGGGCAPLLGLDGDFFGPGDAAIADASPVAPDAASCDRNSDPNNCGGCGVKCGAGEICEGGACKLSCGGGTLQCGNRCVDQNSDPNNCGGCGGVCDAAKPNCRNGGCFALKTYVGIQTNVPVAEVTASGWTQCFVNRFDDSATLVASMTTACAGARIMMACRATGAATLQLMAEAPRADVLFETDTGNVVHNANGTDWYYNNTHWSMGFAPADAGVSRSTCDVASTQADQRLCIHIGGSKFNGGYRCGAATGLNNSAAYERVFFTGP